MQVLVQFYADATPAENPLGLSDEYPWRCKEYADDEVIQTPSGHKLYSLEEFRALKVAFRPEYDQKHAAYAAAYGGK